MNNKYVFSNYLKQIDPPNGSEYNFAKPPDKQLKSPKKRIQNTNLDNNLQTISFNENFQNHHQNKNYYKNDKHSLKESSSFEISHVNSLLKIEDDENITLEKQQNDKKIRSNNADLLTVSEVIYNVDLSSKKKDQKEPTNKPLPLPATQNKVYRNLMYLKKNKLNAYDLKTSSIEKKYNKSKEKTEFNRNIFNVQNIQDFQSYVDSKSKDSVKYKNLRISNSYHKSIDSVNKFQDSNAKDNTHNTNRMSNIQFMISEQKNHDFDKKTKELIKKIKHTNPKQQKNHNSKFISASMPFQPNFLTPRLKFDAKLNDSKLNDSAGNKNFDKSAISFASKNSNKMDYTTNFTFQNHLETSMNPKVKLSCLKKDKLKSDFSNILNRIEVDDEIFIENYQYKIAKEKHDQSFYNQNNKSSEEFYNSKKSSYTSPNNYTPRVKLNKIENVQSSTTNASNKFDNVELRVSAKLDNCKLNNENNSNNHMDSTMKYESSGYLINDDISYTNCFKVNIPYKKNITKLRLGKVNALPGMKDQLKLAQTERFTTKSTEADKSTDKLKSSKNKGNKTSRLNNNDGVDAATTIYNANRNPKADLSMPRYLVDFLMNENINTNILDKRIKLREQTISNFNSFIEELAIRQKSNYVKIWEQSEFDEIKKEYVHRALEKPRVDYRSGRLVEPKVACRDEALEVMKNQIDKEGGYIPLREFFEASRRLFKVTTSLIDDAISNNKDEGDKITKNLDIRLGNARAKRDIEITSEYPDTYEWAFAEVFKEVVDKIRKENPILEQNTFSRVNDTCNTTMNWKLRNEDISIIDQENYDISLKNTLKGNKEMLNQLQFDPTYQTNTTTDFNKNQIY